MNLLDAKPSLLSARSKAFRGPELLLVDGDCHALHGECSLPALPPSFKGTVGDRLDHVDGPRRTILIGCGKIADFDAEERFWESAGASAIDALRALRLEKASLIAPPSPRQIDVQSATNHLALGATLASYRCTAFRSKPPMSHFEIAEFKLPAAVWKGTARIRQLAESINWARALVDAPANVMTPQAFAAAAQALVEFGVQVRVLEQRALEKLGAGGLLAVGRSSEHPPCMLVCQWRGRSGKDFDLGLVGKGLTFDAGGLNLKTAPGIAKMKLDMAGAAAVVGALRVMAQRRAPMNVVAAIPLCENVIDGTAYRPGDVITSLSGLTIEVDNTDAEGRIVLADGITYLLQQHQPKRLIDVATLTGAIVSALHEEFGGLFCNDESLAADLTAAATRSGEALWRLPLSKRQNYLVDSGIADVKNVGIPGLFGNAAGSSIAGAQFLQKFVGDTPWAHLDIAGVAWATRPSPGIQKGPTGFGVRLIDALVEAAQSHVMSS